MAIRYEPRYRHERRGVRCQKLLRLRVDEKSAPIQGSRERPRMAIYRSLKHFHVQIIDDAAGRTLAAASTLSPEIRETVKCGGNIKAAAAVGELLAKKAAEKKIVDKIGWTGKIRRRRTRDFLTAFYTAQRAHLEREQLYGRHRPDKSA